MKSIKISSLLAVVLVLAGLLLLGPRTPKAGQPMASPTATKAPH